LHHRVGGIGAASHPLRVRSGTSPKPAAPADGVRRAMRPRGTKGVGYRDLGEAYLDQLNQSRTAANLRRRLERRGYIVTLQPREDAAV